MVIGERQRYGDLAIVLLAELAAVLRATPTECLPCLGKPVSSMIHASIGPWLSIAGRTVSPTLVNTFSSDHGDLPTKWSND